MRKGNAGRRVRGCAVFLLAAALVSSTPAARAYHAADEEAAKSAAETFLRNYQTEAMLYTDTDQGECSVASAPQGTGGQTFQIAGRVVALDRLRENIAFVEKKAAFYAAMRQMQGIARTDLKLEYTYRSLKLEANTGHASLTETATFYYSDSERMSVYETPYSVDLIKLNGQWLVADVTDGGRFDGLYKASPVFDVSAALAKFAESITTENCTVSWPYPSDELENMGGYHLPYQGENAAAYAYTYARQSADTDRSKFYNSQFKGYAGEGGDCMNYASQCMWAGFGGNQTEEAIDGRLLPMDIQGAAYWYGRSPDSEVKDKEILTWISCQTFRRYLMGDEETAGSNFSSDSGMYATVLDIGAGSPAAGVTPEELVGAAAHVEGSGGAYAHAIVLTAATGTSRSQIWFCSHTKDVTHVKLGDYYIGPMKIYIPRCLRLDAPPPDMPVAERIPPVQIGQSGMLGFHTAGKQARMTLTVTPPEGEPVLAASAEGTERCTAEYLFEREGLYRVECRAQAAEIAEEQSTVYYIRCRP